MTADLPDTTVHAGTGIVGAVDGTTLLDLIVAVVHIIVQVIA